MTESRRKWQSAICAVLAAIGPAAVLHAQQRPDATVSLAEPARQSMPTLQAPGAQNPDVRSATVPSTESGPRLTLAEAEQMAIKNNPRMSVARLIALAQHQVTREVRSAEMPTVNGNLTAVDAREGSRVTAGALNNPVVYNRAAGGLTVSQLITDFGRTHHLVQSAKSNEQAQLDTQRATAEEIALAVDQAFYQALTNQAVLKVAQQTVAQRQATGSQISALTSSKLRSNLDLSFANVEISQANLLQLDAQSNLQNSMAALNAILGSEQNTQYVLVDNVPEILDPAPQDVEPLVQLAFKSRPDLASLNDSYNAARQWSAAERDLKMPTVSALGVGGGAPVRADQIPSPWYGAAGVNVQIPVFNGFLFTARAHEADLRANAVNEQARNLRDEIARDVRTAVLNAQAAFQRIAVTKELLNQSNLAYDLAQTRYKLGLSGIVELSQAQLAQTQGEIAYSNARYAYESALAMVRFETGQ